MAAAKKILDAKIYLGPNLIATGTQKRMSVQTNNSTVKTDGGDITTIGKPDGTFTLDVAIPTDDTSTGRLYDAMKSSQVVEIGYGQVGTSRYVAKCIVMSMELTGETADGNQTGTIEFKMTEGAPERVDIANLLTNPGL
jgi:hypothetical protein